MAGGFQDQLEELFAPVRGVSLRKMFGGIGVFKDGMMFALVADDVLYMKGNETTAPKFEAEGFGQWVYEGRGKSVPMPYWQVPDRLFDEPDEFAEWATAAFAVAERANKAKAKPALKSAKRRLANPAKKAPAKPSRKSAKAAARKSKPKKKTAPKRR